MTAGHKKALELIAENKRTRSPFLDLGNLGLTEVPEEVFECVWLEFLSFGTYSIDNLGTYRKLEFGKNTEIPLGYSSTHYLYPKGENISTIVEKLGVKSNRIDNPNKIIVIPNTIAKLKNLSVLILDFNKINNLDFIKFLPKEIRFLDLRNNNIKKILKEYFDIGVVSWDFPHSSDEPIILFGYKKKRRKKTIEKHYDVDILNKHVLFLCVKNNPLESPPPEIIKSGKSAIDVYFSGIQARDSSFDLLHFFYENPDSKGNRIPAEVKEKIQDYENWKVSGTTLDYDSKNDEEGGMTLWMENIHDGTKISFGIKYDVRKPLNQLKTLLVGDGLSGKTSLLKKILSKEFDIGEPQTHGINIHPKDIEIDGESIHVKFWDFGGQEIMHGTHTFFYSKRSIYLLVLDARREGKEDYWLKHIESFGGDSPVLVVLNKLDENPSFDVNRAFLQNKYPNIVGFVRVSCKTGEGIDRLVQELEKQIHALEMRRTPFAKSWFEVKEALDTMGEDYISYDRYYALCHEKEVTDETAQNVLLQFLHDLGIVLAFRNLELHDTQVINPLWLTNAVYRIINSKLVAGKKGYLHLSDLEAILNDPTYAHEGFKYPRNKFLYIVKIMQEFELCYRIAEDVFIVPDLLTVEEQPVPGFDYDTALRFVLQYDFLPASVLPRFMVQLHTRIVEGEQWRTGTALEDPIFKAKAVVKVDRDEKRLYLWVNGPDRDSRRNFFNFIRKTLHDIHGSFEKLTVTELVPVPGHDDIFIEYAELVGYEEMGLADYPVGKLRRKFNVGEMLSGLEAPERRQPRRHAPVKVFVSYSHKDAEYKDELVTALAYLSRMEEIELWQDGRIEAGMEWKKEIFEKLAEAEIVICLVSSNFIASDFCYSIELKEALEGHEAGTKIVVPIQIKTCAWQKLSFGKIQGLPSKPISAFEPRDDGWGEVFAGMEGAVKRAREKR